MNAGDRRREDAELGHDPRYRARARSSRSARGSASSTPARSCSRASCRRSRAAPSATSPGIGLGNEPDIQYSYDLPRYLADLVAYRDAGVTRPYAIVAPSTSETIAPWQSIEARAIQTRFFWDWPAILDTIAPAMKAVRTVHGTLATDHFYPLARGCTTDEYRCASIERLLSDERLANLAYEVYTHAVMARERGLDYRLQETGTAAGRGRRRRLERRRRRDLGARGDARVGVPAAAERAGRERRLRDRARSASTSTTRRSTGSSSRGGQRVLQRDRLRPVAGRGCARRRAAVLRAAAVLALRAGHPRPASASRSRPARTRPRGSGRGRSTRAAKAGGCSSSTSRARPLTAAVRAPASATRSTG